MPFCIFRTIFYHLWLVAQKEKGSYMSRLLIKNVILVLPDHMIPNASLLVEDGKIADFGRDIECEDCETVDGHGLYLGPGLIDIHTHGAKDKFITEDPEASSKFLFDKGVTSVLVALYYNMNKDRYIAAMRKLKSYMDSGKTKNLLGFYMEGPYLNPNYGCSRENNPWLDAPKAEDYEAIIEEALPYAKVWCLAPEREGILDFVKAVKKKDANAIFSVAHSEAAPEDIEKLIPYGLRLSTHHTNATGTRFKYSECRGVCVDETVNYRDEIYAELICDSYGMHVDPYMLRLVRKLKGEKRIILISDNYPCDGIPPKGYEYLTDLNFDDAGEIAGSKLSLDLACKNMMMHTGASLCDVFRYASTNPADLLGRNDLGRIAIGADADLVLADHLFNIQGTISKGEIKKWQKNSL